MNPHTNHVVDCFSYQVFIYELKALRFCFSIFFSPLLCPFNVFMPTLVLEANFRIGMCLLRFLIVISLRLVH
jgi:hypothetical protein